MRTPSNITTRIKATKTIRNWLRGFTASVANRKVDPFATYPDLSLGSELHSGSYTNGPSIPKRCLGCGTWMYLVHACTQITPWIFMISKWTEETWRNNYETRWNNMKYVRSLQTMALWVTGGKAESQVSGLRKSHGPSHVEAPQT